MKKKILCVLMAFCMAVPMLPSAAAPFTETAQAATAKGIPFDELVKYTPYGDKADVPVKAKYTTSASPTLADMTKAPESFRQKERPKELPMIAYGILHIGDTGKQGQVTAYFSPSTTGYARGHFLNELVDLGIMRSKNSINTSKGNMQDSNAALWVYTGSIYEIVGYDDNWVAVWDTGLWNDNVVGGGVCPFVFYEGYYHPGVYYIPRKYVYIIDKDNHIGNAPKLEQSGTAAALLAVKTAPEKKNYIMSGVIKQNQSFQILNKEPVNGHYEIFYQRGRYYVNAEYVNIKLPNIKQPRITYTATVNAGKYNYINVRSEANMESAVAGKVKTGMNIEIIDKDAGDKMAKIWFNSKECYLSREFLKNIVSTEPLAKRAGDIKGIIIANKGTVRGFTRLVELDSGYVNALGGYSLPKGSWAPVYEIKKSSYNKKLLGGKTKKVTQTFYKILWQDKLVWAKHESDRSAAANGFTYYKGRDSVNVNAVSGNRIIYVDSKKYEAATYYLNGRRYIGIDDVAKMFAGTSRKFGLNWDKKADYLNLLTMFDYTSTGKELKGGTGKKVRGVSTMTSITLDGRSVNTDCYKIGGVYCFRLSALMEALNCKIEYNNKAKVITINTTKPYREDPNEIKG